MEQQSKRFACWTVAVIIMAGFASLFAMMMNGQLGDTCEARCLSYEPCIRAIIAEGIAPSGYHLEQDIGLCRGMCSGLRQAELHAKKQAQSWGVSLEGKHPCLP